VCPLDEKVSGWVFEQAAALIVALLWVANLLRENSTLRKQREALSVQLIRFIENASRERAQMTDELLLRLESFARTMSQAFFSAASNKRKSSGDSGPPPPAAA
jgi:hypothetical protein